MKKTRIGRAGTALTLGALAAMALTGCVTPAASEEENVSAACAALAELDAALTAAESDLADAETVGDLRTIRETVTAAYTEADSALDAVAADRAEALSDSWQGFLDAATDIDGDASLDDARASLVEEARDVAQTRQEAAADLKCE